MIKDTVERNWFDKKKFLVAVGLFRNLLIHCATLQNKFTEKHDKISQTEQYTQRGNLNPLAPRSV